jgi:RNA polymerase sigma-70 factor (ECF subfamily)
MPLRLDFPTVAADLERRFLSRLAAPARARLESAPDLEARLEACVQEAREAWPALDVAPEILADRLAQALGEDGDLETLEALHVGDLALAIACERQDRAALDALERQVLPAAAKTRRGQLPDEVLQKLREKLILQGRISEYGGRGALAQWLRMVGARLWLDTDTSARREVSLDESPGALDALLDSDPELKFLRREARALLRTALQHGFRQLSPRHRTLLRLHHVSRLPHGKLGEMMGAPRSTIAHWLTQARDALMAGAKAWLRQERAVDSAELESLLDAAGSRLDVTLSDVLASQTSAGSTP